MLVRAPNGSFEFIDFRETAPGAASEDMYNGNENASVVGGLARYTQYTPFDRIALTLPSGVPGELR